MVISLFMDTQGKYHTLNKEAYISEALSDLSGIYW